MILTGLAMSPAHERGAALACRTFSVAGRRRARSISLAMALLVGFFVIHIAMILAAGPFNELRSIITGWYRTDPPAP